jgi:hypothetical protein
VADITSIADLLGGLIGVAIGVAVIVYRERLAAWATEGFHMGGSEGSLARVYAALGALAILIAIGSVFVL